MEGHVVEPYPPNNLGGRREQSERPLVGSIRPGGVVAAPVEAHTHREGVIFGRRARGPRNVVGQGLTSKALG